MNRSQQKRITQQAKIARHMRKTRGLSLNKAGRMVKISGSAISHMEQGQMDTSRERLKSSVHTSCHRTGPLAALQRGRLRSALAWTDKGTLIAPIHVK